VLVEALGGAGYAGYTGTVSTGTYIGGNGGAGGYLSTLIPVSGAQTLSISVGQGGAAGTPGTSSTGGSGGFGGGGSGASGFYAAGGGGGGESLVSIGGTTEVVAAGGGGGESSYQGGGALPGEAGGAGGVGVDASGGAGAVYLYSAAQGGTDAGGGAGASTPSNGSSGATGAANQGGNGGGAAGFSGGGGGSGYYGGGGGANLAGGAGGANYAITGNLASNASAWTPPSQANGEVVVTAEECQTVTPGSAPSSPTAGGNYTPSATTTSTLSATFTVDASTSSKCSIASGVVSFNTAGSCTVDENQGGNASWGPAPQAQQTFTIAATVAGAPTSVVATPATGSVSVAWTAPAFTGGVSISTYAVRYSSNGGTTWTASVACSAATSSPCAITGLTAGAYVFDVDATNSVGPSAWSTASSSINYVTAPGAPTGVAATITTGSASVSWTVPASTGGSAIISYAVQYSSNAGGTWTASGACSAATSSPCTVTGLAVGSYLFEVDATNTVGPSAWSTASSSVNYYSAPGAPTTVAATSASGTVPVTWVAPVNNGGTAIISYAVQYSSNAGGTWTASSACSAATSSPCSVTGLTSGTYVFEVDATNSVGPSAWSTSSSSLIYVAPARPVTVPASLILTSTSSLIGGTLPLTSSGGAGTGSITYAVTSTGSAECSVVNGALIATRPGTCTLTVSQAASPGYLAATSPATVVTFASEASTSMTLRSLFSKNSTTMTAAARVTLAHLATQVVWENSGVSISAYSDNSGSAVNVSRLLAQRLSVLSTTLSRDLTGLGLAPEHIALRAATHSDYIATNATAAGRAQNARFVFHL
jgi:outer membrane protein OmpA-like peptidoglycan-associated protein